LCKVCASLEALSLVAFPQVSGATIGGTSITHLELHYCGLTVEGVQAMLRNCPSLKNLKITSAQNLSDEAFHQVGKYNPRLSAIELESVPLRLQGWPKLPQLRQFSIHELKFVDDETLRSFVLECCPELTKLRVTIRGEPYNPPQEGESLTEEELEWQRDPPIQPTQAAIESLDSLLPCLQIRFVVDHPYIRRPLMFRSSGCLCCKIPIKRTGKVSYSCRVCDTELCHECFAKNEHGHEKSHGIGRTLGYTCDGTACGKVIPEFTVHWQCIACLAGDVSFDLCKECYSAKNHQHDPSHEFALVEGTLEEAEKRPDGL